jgi:hypothetical protein
VVVLVRLGETLGWWVLAWVVLAACAGFALMKEARFALVSRLAAGFAQGRLEIAALTDSARTVLAGLLLIFPGVVSDLIAITLLLLPGPARRDRVGRAPGPARNPDRRRVPPHALARAASQRRIARPFRDRPPGSARAERPHLHRSAGRNRARGGHAPGHRAAVRLPQRRVRGVQGGAAIGHARIRRVPGARAARIREAGWQGLTCCTRPLSDVVFEVRELTGAKDLAIRTLPCRVEKVEKPAEDVAILYLKLPRASACSSSPDNTSTC